MKTAISVPDDVYARGERVAQELGVSRSEFYSRAARNYIDLVESRSLRIQIDQALELIGDSDDSAEFAVEASKAHLRSLGDEW